MSRDIHLMPVPDYLRDLAERLMRVPVMYGVDQGDVDLLYAIARASAPTGGDQDIAYRLRKRAEIRRQIPGRKSVQQGAPDRLADLLEDAALEIEALRLRHG